MSVTSQTDLSTNSASTASVHASNATTLSSLGYDDPLAILGSAPYPDAPWWKRISPSTIFVLLASAIAVFFLLHELTIAGKLGYPTDESWIDQVYARNLFHNLSFEFNQGERTVGPTAPFWVVGVSMAVALFHDPIIAGKLLGTIFLFLTGYYAFRLLRTVGNDYGSSLLGGVLIVTVSQLAWSELSGLESTLSAALVVGGMWWYFANPNGWRRAITGAIFALAALTRPETALIFALLLRYEIAKNRSDRKQGIVSAGFARGEAFMLLVFIVVLLPVAVTNLAISGAIVPETFYAGLSNHSLVRLIRHGEFVELGKRIVLGLQSIPMCIGQVYLPAGPLWIVTIGGALWLRRKNPLIVRDRSDQLLTFSVLVLLAFPYLRALTLGTDDRFGEYGRWMHFLLPVYLLAGVTSLRIVVRYGLFRMFGQKALVMWMCIASVITSAVYLLSRSDSAPSFAAIPPIVDYVLVLFFTGLLAVVGLRHVGITLWKKEQPFFVTEEEREKLTFTITDGREEGPQLPEPMIRILRAALLIALAWNLTELPRTANDFGANVREMNTQHLGLAKTIASITAPTDVIATNSIGAIGWMSDRRVIDISGHLTKGPNENARTLGPERGLLKTLLDERPQYLAIFGEEYRGAISEGVEAGFLRAVSPGLFRIDTGHSRALRALTK